MVCIVQYIVLQLGGAIAAYSGTQLEMHNCNVTYNAANDNGGGIYAVTNTTYVAMYGCIISFNGYDYVAADTVLHGM